MSAPSIIEKVSGFRSRVINAIIEELRRLTLQPGPGYRVSRGPGGTSLHIEHPAPPPPGWPFGKEFAWGIEVGQEEDGGRTVIIHPGTLQVNSSLVTTVLAEIVITASGQYIGIEYDRDAGTAEVTGPHDERPKPDALDDDGVIKIWRAALYQFDLDDGVLMLTREYVNDIRIGDDEELDINTITWCDQDGEPQSARILSDRDIDIPCQADEEGSGGSGPDEPTPPPCGHPGNLPGYHSGGSGGDHNHYDDHPGNDYADPSHPGDTPSPPCGTPA